MGMADANRDAGGVRRAIDWTGRETRLGGALMAVLNGDDKGYSCKDDFHFVHR